MNNLSETPIFTILNYGLLIVLISGIVLCRKLLARRFVDVSMEVTGNAYSKEKYQKKVAWFGWTVVGGLATFLSIAALVISKTAPTEEIRAELAFVTPWAVAGMVSGLFTYSATLMKGIGIKPDSVNKPKPSAPHPKKIH